MNKEEKKAIEYWKRDIKLYHYNTQLASEYYAQIILNLIQKQEKIIKEYENECRRFKAFCKRIRKDEKRNVDEFNQGQEQKCNEFLNLISGEPHWLYEGKYFDETDKEVEYFKKEVEKDVKD